MHLLAHLAPHFEHYLTLHRLHPSATYENAARKVTQHRVIEFIRHRPKCTRGSWLYVAVTQGARLEELSPPDKLFVGCQTDDRLFRGDGLEGEIFHHDQMRVGRRGRGDSLTTELAAGRQVDVHCIAGEAIARAVERSPALHGFKPLLDRGSGHVGSWFEQYLLMEEVAQWRWNERGATTRAKRLMRSLGVGL